MRPGNGRAAMRCQWSCDEGGDEGERRDDLHAHPGLDSCPGVRRRDASTRNWAIPSTMNRPLASQLEVNLPNGALTRKVAGKANREDA